NAMLAREGFNWVCYGAFSFFRLVPGHDGPRPDGDDFVPHGGALEKLDGPRDARLVSAFRQALLLSGADFMAGMAGMASSAHTEAHVEPTVAAGGAALRPLRHA